MTMKNRRRIGNVLFCGPILFLAFIVFITPTFAGAEPPASFMDLPLMKKDPALNRIDNMEIKLRQFTNKIAEGTKYSWKQLDKGQWRLTSEEFDKMTDKKHTGIFLFVPESKGVSLSRMIVDGVEMSKFQIDEFVISIYNQIINKKK
jgi:hypothetical protein